MMKKATRALRLWFRRAFNGPQTKEFLYNLKRGLQLLALTASILLIRSNLGALDISLHPLLDMALALALGVTAVAAGIRLGVALLSAAENYLESHVTIKNRFTVINSENETLVLSGKARKSNLFRTKKAILEEVQKDLNIVSNTFGKDVKNLAHYDQILELTRYMGELSRQINFALAAKTGKKEKDTSENSLEDLTHQAMDRLKETAEALKTLLETEQENGFILTKKSKTNTVNMFEAKPSSLLETASEIDLLKKSLVALDQMEYVDAKDSQAS